MFYAFRSVRSSDERFEYYPSIILKRFKMCISTKVEKREIAKISCNIRVMVMSAITIITAELLLLYIATLYRSNNKSHHEQQIGNTECVNNF